MSSDSRTWRKLTIINANTETNGSSIEDIDSELGITRE